MGTRAAGALLFVAALLCVPFPMLGLEGSLVPVARYLQLAVVSLALLLREGPQGVVGILVALLAGHALFYASALAAATWLLARFGLARLSARGRVLAAAVGVAALVAATGSLHLYDTQFHHTSAHARLFELYR